ncbi:MAG: hypothetical protein ACNS60_15565 [Candidatus Cyclobacteriaceae bacterium M2_1C_046]
MIALKNPSDPNEFNVLLIGNNPIELSTIYERLIKLKDKKFIAEFAFDLRSALKGKFNFRPSFIIIDDNIGRAQFKNIVDAFHKNKYTADVPITVLKNKNGGYSPEGVQEYILKDNADGESLSKALFNSQRLIRTQKMLYNTYFKGKRKLKRAFH